jgi:hypothetical protein
MQQHHANTYEKKSGYEMKDKIVFKMDNSDIFVYEGEIVGYIMLQGEIREYRVLLGEKIYTVLPKDICEYDFFMGL